jgi:hypothetical protein
MMWKVLKLGAGGLGLVLAGCVATDAQVAPDPAMAASSIDDVKAARDVADRAWLKCVVPLLTHLDDGTSDPQSIAIGARAGCSEQFRRLVFAYLPLDGSVTQLMPIMETSVDRNSVKRVLEHRVSRRHHPNK